MSFAPRLPRERRTTSLTSVEARGTGTLIPDTPPVTGVSHPQPDRYGVRRKV